MKKIIVFIMFGLFLGGSISVEAQILEKLKKKIEKKAEKKADQKIDKTIDKGFKEIEEELAKKKADSIQREKEATKKRSEQVQGEGQQQQPGVSKLTLNWSKYDFVPGDKVIFEDNQENEENGEFPSRWDLVRGTIENAEFGGDNIIMFRGGAPTIVPYLKNPEKDYLPEIFTIEFDLYTNNHNYFQVLFWDKKNQSASSKYRPLEINYQGLYLSPASSQIPNKKTIENKWAHIAIACTNGKLKAYIDETRLINIPRLAFDPMGISLYAYSASDQTKFYIKNFRIAEGGVKYYDKFLQDGKIVTNGIRFEVNKATLKSESMGVINKIVKLMKQHPEIKFSVEGHTDSDGDDSSNLTLSEERAQAVLEQLISMGIVNARLTSKGFGETMPIDSNHTPEGKANNRRVEFVKIPNQQ